ncbi:MAG: winged helix-turn-helix domain-containing tetratricopeptide repeat protein [Vicinamibacterales bacterium]
MHASERPDTYRFGTFVLDVRSRELRTAGAPVRLQEQPFEILLAMLERPGEVITREALRRRLWPDGTFVDFEHSLNAAVKRLRVALGDSADQPRFVETVPRRGYRFTAPVLTGRGGTVEAAAPAVRLAVLPFTSLGESREQDYFSDGLTEEMIAQLGRLCRGRVGVIARWSSMAFKHSPLGAAEIGRVLRVAYVLEGSVRMAGDRIRVTARLVETAGETDLWVETYDRDVVDVLTVQADVAGHIARALATELAPGVARPDAPARQAAATTPQAYQTYLKGLYHWNKPGDTGLEAALGYFEQVVREDPAFAGAHAALARAHVTRAEHYRVVPREALVAARSCAERALALGPDLSDAHLAMGHVRRLADWNWAGAEQDYRRAIALNPSSPAPRRLYATLLASFGRHDEAVREVRRALDLDPLCLEVGVTVAWVELLAGRPESAVAWCHNTIEMDPQYAVVRRVLAMALMTMGRTADAVAHLEALVEGGSGDAVLLAALGHARAVSGNRAGASAMLEALGTLSATRYVSGYHLALVHAGLGDAESACAALARACDDRDPMLLQLRREPRFERLRGDHRYRTLLARLHIEGDLPSTDPSPAIVAGD